VDGLIPSLLSSLLVDMANRIIVESHQIDHFINDLLKSAPVVARHTSIVHLSAFGNRVKSVQYIWANKFMQPWGKRLPAQCSECLSFRPWDKPVSTGGSDGNVYLFKCRGTKANGSGCANILTFKKPAGFISASDDWITLSWPSTRSRTC
jgi:hypothetical protein